MSAIHSPESLLALHHAEHADALRERRRVAAAGAGPERRPSAHEGSVAEGRVHRIDGALRRQRPVDCVAVGCAV